MDPADAVAELASQSSQLRAIVVGERGGGPVAATVGPDAARAVLAAAAGLVDRAERLGRDAGRGPFGWLEAATGEASLCLAVDDRHVAVGVTAPEPPAGLVLYDLRMLLRRIGAAPAAAVPEAEAPVARA